MGIKQVKDGCWTFADGDTVCYPFKKSTTSPHMVITMTDVNVPTVENCSVTTGGIAEVLSAIRANEIPVIKVVVMSGKITDNLWGVARGQYDASIFIYSDDLVFVNFARDSGNTVDLITFEFNIQGDFKNVTVERLAPLPI